MEKTWFWLVVRSQFSSNGSEAAGGTVDSCTCFRKQEEIIEARTSPRMVVKKPDRYGGFVKH